MPRFCPNGCGWPEDRCHCQRYETPESVTPVVTKLPEPVTNNVTLSVGRPRQYASNAERQAAYRGRHKRDSAK